MYTRKLNTNTDNSQTYEQEINGLLLKVTEVFKQLAKK